MSPRLQAPKVAGLVRSSLYDNILLLLGRFVEVNGGKAVSSSLMSEVKEEMKVNKADAAGSNLRLGLCTCRFWVESGVASRLDDMRNKEMVLLVFHRVVVVTCRCLSKRHSLGC